MGHSQAPQGPPWSQGLKLHSQAAASPFDYVKAGAAAADRAQALGLTPTRLTDSFSGNQSFPRCSVTSQQLARRLESPCLASQARLQSPYLADTGRSTDGLANCSLLAQGGRGSRLMQNPNKAWAIICAERGQILVNNSILSALLGYSDEKLRSFTLWDLIIKRGGKKKQEALDQLDIDPDSGDTLAYSGRVVTLKCADEESCTVSLNIKKLVDSTRFMVFLEPVQRTVGFIDMDCNGIITDVDSNIEIIFQVRSCDCIGESIANLIPFIEFPEEAPGCSVKLACTGRIDEDISFPISCIVTREDLGSAVDYSSAGEIAGCRVAVWVYSSLSGLLLLDNHGVVTQCDESFSNLVLGYNNAGLEGKKIEDVIPGFYDEFDVPSCDKTDEDLGCEDLSPSYDNVEKLEENSPLEEISLNVQSLNLNSPKHQARPCFGSPGIFKQPMPVEDPPEKENFEDSPVFKRPNSLSVRTPVKIPMELLTSTPASSSRKIRPRADISLDRSRPRLNCSQDRMMKHHNRSVDESMMPSGCFYGLARHKTGGEISVLYQVKRIVMKSSEIIYCVWVTRDSDDVAGKTHAHLTLASTFPTITDDDTESKENTQSTARTEPLFSENQDKFGDISIGSLTEGLYTDSYVTLHQIGKGAFGCVRAAYRISDKLLVVTKFINKAKVPADSWVDGAQGEKIPFEASLLTALEHPGIVGVLDTFQNRSYVQLVMDKHGDMDLFEFIDRNPIMDEGLASLIFRQIVAAIDYLHAKDILHRDVKDENIIIDHTFNCKLIDFGSATFYKPGQMFSTFYGTVEYCSPEVLKGCSYEGPELEMWSLGVLLYIIMFGENPFYDADDTMRAELHPPHNDISTNCWDLVESCLDPDPKKRASLWHIKEHAWVNMAVSASDYRLYDVIPCTESELRPCTHYQDIPEPPSYLCQVSQCSGAVESQDHSLDSTRDMSSLDSNKDCNYSQLESTKDYSNLCTTAELDQLATMGDQSSIEYSNLQTSLEIVGDSENVNVSK